MTKVELKGSVGDEIALVHGENTLIVKIAKDAIVPDVVASVMKAINTDANIVMLCAQNVFHHTINSQNYAKQQLAVVRDRIFNGIKPEIVEAPPQKTVVVEEKKATTAKKTAATSSKSAKTAKKPEAKR